MKRLWIMALSVGFLVLTFLAFATRVHAERIYDPDNYVDFFCKPTVGLIDLNNSTITVCRSSTTVETPKELWVWQGRNDKFYRPSFDWFFVEAYLCRSRDEDEIYLGTWYHYTRKKTK